MFQTGDAGKGAFSQRKNFVDGVSFWCARESIAAAFSTGTFDEFPLYEKFNHAFQIFFGNALALGNVVQRHGGILGLLGKIDHQANGVAAFGRNHDHIPPFAYFTSG